MSPVNRKMMKAMKKEYGKKWENVYYAIEMKRKHKRK